MKKILSLMAMLLVASVMVSFGQNLAGSPHDFTDATGAGSADDWNTSTTNQLCGVCHTPHNAVSTRGPIWSRGDVTNGAYTLYGTTVNGTVVGAPNASSVACLTCHDGATTLENHIYDGAAASAKTVASYGANLNLGTDLSNSHPVSVAYNEGDAGFNAEATTFPATTISVLDRLVGGTGGTVECSSCHNPHDPGTGQFLISSNANSGLCLTCHNK